MKKFVAVLAVLGLGGFLGYRALMNWTVDINPASIARSMSPEERAEACNALSGGTEGGFAVCMEGMDLASSGIQNEVIPDLAQPALWANYKSGYSLTMRNNWVNSFAKDSIPGFGACLFDMLASSMPYEDFEIASARIRAGADPKSLPKFSLAMDDCTNGTFYSLKNNEGSTESDASSESESATDSSSDSETVYTLAPYNDDSSETLDTSSGSAGDLTYFSSLSEWTSGSFQTMLNNSVVGSPAWSYAYHLINGRNSEMQSGRSEGSSIKIIDNGDSLNVCFTKSCSVLIDRIETQDGKVSNYYVNGRDLSSSIVSHSEEDAAICSDVGFCATLRSAFWFGNTVYATVEVRVNDSSVYKADAVSQKLKMPTEELISLSSGTSPTATPSESAYYSLGFKTTVDPWGGFVNVRVKTSLGTDTVRLPL
jgi:hypothetical protein